jgi:ferrous iron transport protein B
VKTEPPSCHSSGTSLEDAMPSRSSDRGTTTVLVGNPNVGKSVLFKNLTNRYVTVSNFPGTTVEIFRAAASFNGRNVEIIDTPGINDLTPTSEDARVTRALLDQHDNATLIQVADAKNLRRSLLLTLQLADLGRPMVLVLNMADELEERGGVIDTDRLGAILGVPVVSTVAIRNQGTGALIEALANARPLQIDGPTPTDVYNGFGGNSERVSQANAILGETYSISQPEHASFRVRLGFWAMDPLRGLGFMAVVTLAVFWFVGLFGAGTLVDILEVGVFQQRLSPIAIRGVDAVLPFPHVHETGLIEHTLAVPLSPAHEVPAYTLGTGTTLSPVQSVLRFVHDFLVGEYGAITMALSYALAIVLPIVTTFFLIFSILEDSGYFPRMAIMVNRSFRAIG